MSIQHRSHRGMPRREPIHVLLVEDNDDHAHLILRGINRANLTSNTERLPDGATALSYLRAEGSYSRRRPPDLVLLDINLPNLSGHDVLAAIRADPRVCTTPVIMLSTSSSDADVSSAYQRHANAYVVKPSDFEELCTLIRDLLVFWGRWNVARRSPK